MNCNSCCNDTSTSHLTGFCILCWAALTCFCSLPNAEVSQRIQTAHPGGRQVMLHYLLPWMNNIELVDFKPLVRRQEDPEEEENAREREMMVNSRRWLRGEGWGSPQATTMILNNLMFMTAKVHTHTVL